MESETPKQEIRLNLGCGHELMAGWVNVDKHAPTIPIPPGVRFSLIPLSNNYPWPWSDGTVDEIRAKDFFEHLPDIIDTMNQCWRVLKHGGLLTIIVPTTNGPGAWQDPTHRSWWNANTFKYFEDGSPYRDSFAGRNGIIARFRIVKIRTWESAQGDGERLEALLEAVKR